MNRFLFLSLMLFANATLFAQTWTIISPRVTGSERRSIQMVSDSVGYSGGYGMPLKTTDGGASWFYPSNRANVSGVTMTWFATPDSGWASFNSQQLWRTTNGGASWDSLYGVGVFEIISSLRFFNSRVGCAVGRSVVPTVAGRAWWTNDGGNSWTAVTTARPLSDIQLLSPTLAVACADSGKIYRTTNAGATWSVISTPTTAGLNGIYFRTPSEGYAVGASGTDLRTNDSGKTWGLSSVFTTQTLNDVTSLEQMGNRIFVGNNNTVYSQPNGSLTPFPNLFINYYAITSRVVNNVETIYLAGQGGLILTSTNGGSTWRVRNGSPFRYTAIDFPTQSVGYIGGQGGSLLKTTNGGASWDTLLTSYSNDIVDLKFPSSSTGYALIRVSNPSRDSLLKTTNGGASWTVQPLPTSIQCNRLFFLNNSLGFAVGVMGSTPIVLKTTDGGASWTSSGSGASRDVCFVSPTIGYAVGAGGAIRKTTDGGNTWESQFSGTTAMLNRVVFLDSLTGFACGGTAFLKTTNGGASWTSIGISGSVSNLVDMFFLDSQHGALLNASNVYYRTTNGGASWQQFSHSGGTNFVSRFFFLNGQTGFIVGDYGMIQKTNNAQLPVEWSHFTAQAHREGVLLKWTTQTEFNNSGFEIERKRTGEEWQSIGFVRGNGTSAMPRSYSFIDKLASGAMRYRLKQIDLDGKFEYSPIVEINAGLPRSFALEQNYPNPFNPTTTIRYQLAATSDAQLVLYDALGRVVAQLVNARQAAGAYSVSVNASELNLSSGVYFYRLQTGNGFAQTKKMMLLK